MVILRTKKQIAGRNESVVLNFNKTGIREYGKASRVKSALKKSYAIKIGRS